MQYLARQNTQIMHKVDVTLVVKKVKMVSIFPNCLIATSYANWRHINCPNNRFVFFLSGEQIPYNMERILFLFSNQDASQIKKVLEEFESTDKTQIPKETLIKVCFKNTRS